jgi:myo-inositol-1(or 4)-monophosphatase
MQSGDDDLLTLMESAAFEAGAIALAFFNEGAATNARIDWKAGGSPVSEADYSVDVFLRERLGALQPDAGWLSEETTDDSDRMSRERLFIVDPIDGTRAFIKGDPRWAISIALVMQGRPRLAVLHLPALNETFTASAGGGARLNGTPISASARSGLEGAAISGPPKILEDMARRGLAFAPQPRVPSLAYRLALVACGRIEAGIASTNAWDWDIAAADLIVAEAGGCLTDLADCKPAYNASLPRHGVLGAAPVHLHGALIKALRETQI